MGKHLSVVSTRAQALKDSGKELVKLTAENLRMMQKPGDGTRETIADGVADLGDLERTSAARTKRRSQVEANNWQVSVRRHLRSGLAEKEGRKRRIALRMDQLRKDLGDT